MKRKAAVSFVFVVLFLVSTFPMSTFLGAADSRRSSGSSALQFTVDWWPMFHHDLNHAGYSTSMAPNTNQTLWNYSTGDIVRSSPAVSGGVVYVGSGDGNVYALDASTGAYKWNYTTRGLVESSPAVSGGVVYVGSGDGNVYALNASTGALVWNYTTVGHVDSSPAVSGGVVYVGSWDHNVYALNASTGALVWNYTTGDVVEHSSPAVADSIVYVGSGDHHVYALDASSGRQTWNYTTGDRVFSSPAVSGGVVYVGSGDGNVYALDASTGAYKWNYTTRGLVESSPAVSGGIVYVGSEDHNVYALNASTGALVWNYTTGDMVESSPAVAGGRVYVGSWDHNVYALNASTGALVWNYTTGDRVEYSSSAVADGVVFIGSWDNKVYAFGQSYSVTIKAQCITEGVDVNVQITRDGSPTGDTTPCNFTVTGAHTFTVPDADASDHQFKQWSTGETDTTVTVTSSGTYTAYYEEMWPMFHHDLSHTGYSTSKAPSTILWNYSTGGVVDSSPAVSGGVVYVGSGDGNVYALDASTGAYKWNYTTRGLVESSPAVSGGIVYVGSGDGNVYALNASTGALVWNYTTGNSVLSSPAVAGGRVYVGSWDHNVYALDASTGAYKWNYTTRGGVYSSPAVSGGIVYVGSWDHNVYALNASTGALVWNYTTGDMVESSPAVAGGRLYVGSDDNKTYAFGPHDVAVANVTLSKTIVCQGDPSFDITANMSVTVANLGSYPETFKVTAYAANSSLLTGFRKPITITGSGSNLTDYQVLLTMDTASLISTGKMRPDCGDMRFKDSAGSDIPYWIEPETNNTSNTRIWVKVPNIPSSGSKTIYMYYGNATANSQSNGTATFCFFDDFTSSNTTKWNVTTSGNAKASVSNGELVLSAAGGSLSGDSVSLILKSVLQGSYIIGAKAGRHSALGESQTGIIWRVNEAGPWLNNEHWVYQCYYNGSDSAYLSMSNDTGFAGPSLTGVPISGAGVTGYIKRDYPGENYYSVVDGTQQAGSLNESADGDWTTVWNTNRVGITANNYNSVPSFNFVYDWFFVANYTFPEPTIHVGEQEPSYTIGSQTVTLSSGNSTNLIFTWHTTGFPEGNYTLSAYAVPVSGETNTMNNNFTDGWALVVIVGDVNADSKVDGKDLGWVAWCFGSYPGSPTISWNPNCDINNDGKIDGKDLGTVAWHFGEPHP